MRASTILVAVVFMIAVALSLLVERVAACERTEREWYNPSGWEGCSAYGTGWASWWAGPGVARNDCLWPWNTCSPITIVAIQTGRAITVTPMMYCDCYTRTSNQRLVDLDPAALKALGLWHDRARGLFRVRVTPANELPDTAIR